MESVTKVAFLILFSVTQIDANREGAPPSACASMHPQHAENEVNSISDSPYEVVAEKLPNGQVNGKVLDFLLIFISD